MTLNFRRNSRFTNNSDSISDMLSSIWVENGIISQERNCGDVCGQSWKHFREEAIKPRREMNNLVDYVHYDILDVLPADPFGVESYNSISCLSSELDHDDVFSDSDLDVDLEHAALTVAGWFEDFDGKSEGNPDAMDEMGLMIFEGNGLDIVEQDCQLFAGWKFLWSNAVRFQKSFPDYTAGSTNTSAIGLDDLVINENFCDGLHSLKLREENETFDYEHDMMGNVNGNSRITDCGECSASSCVGESGDGGAAPHDAIFFALGCLGLKDLLSVSGVCRSLNDAVQNDPLLWRRIYVGHPLNSRLTDGILISLTNKAQGSLQCLTLIDCYEITGAGLKYVLESNPNITKLGISGCVRLTIEGIIHNLKSFRSVSGHGFERLRLGDLYGVTAKHYEELLALLDTSTHGTRVSRTPQHYHFGSSISHDDDRLIDVEVCPRCENVRLVYDCPAESCRLKPPTDANACRGCTFCIAHCVQCGVCVKDGEYEETFSLDRLCFRCWWLLFDEPAPDEYSDYKVAIEPFYARRDQLNCSSCFTYLC